MNSLWLVLDRLLPEKICDSILEHYDNSVTKNAEYGDGVYDRSYRFSRILGMPQGDQANLWIEKILSKYVIQANAECFGLNLNGFNEFQIAKYEQGGHYDFHTDMRLDGRSSMRKLSVTVQLSESKDYEGGDFEFSEDIGTPDQSLIREKGTIIVFPSFVRHRVKPVTRGTRFSLVGWYEGNSWT